MGNVDAARWPTLRAALGRLGVGMRGLFLLLLVSQCSADDLDGWSSAAIQSAPARQVSHHKHHHKHRKHHEHKSGVVRLNAEIAAPPTKESIVLANIEAEVEAEVEAGAGAPMPPTLNTTLRLLNQSQHDVLALEASITELHKRLGGAENVIVGASQNVSYIREQIFQLKNAANKNKGYLWDLGRYDAKLNGTLDADNFEVDQTGPALKDTSQAAADMAKAAKSAISDAELEKLRALNEKLWKATDPTEPNSVDKTNERVKKGEKKVEEFEKEIKKHIQKMSVKQLRRGGNKLRKAIRHLDRVAGGEAVDIATRNAGERDGGLEGLRDGVVT